MAQGEMRAKPDMKPWVNIEQQNKELRRSGTYTSTQMLQRINTIQRNNTPNTRAEVPPLKGLNKCVPMINPGLTPWAMQEYRPVGALR